MADKFFKTRYYDDLNVGDSWRTNTKTITETDMVLFNSMLGIALPAFVDEEYMKSGTIFGRRFATGVMTIPLAAGLFTQLHLLDDSLMAMLGMESKMLKPLFAGDTIYVDVEVIGKKETSKPDRGVVRFLYLTKNQRHETLAEITEVIMVKRVQKQ
jgi:acyl dehydratase